MERTTLDDIIQHLRIPHRRRQSIERELRSHLEETRRELELSGWRPEEAERESLNRLGDPREIADGFARVYRPSRRTQVGLAMALATGMLLGMWGIGGSLASATSAHSRVHAHPAHVTHHVTRP